MLPANAAEASPTPSAASTVDRLYWLSRETSASACAGSTAVTYAMFCVRPPLQSDNAASASAATHKGKRIDE